jgi:hypothetical protein
VAGFQVLARNTDCTIKQVLLLFCDRRRQIKPGFAYGSGN